MREGDMKWNFVQEDNSSEESNGQLECKVVTNLTGKLWVTKNG